MESSVREPRHQTGESIHWQDDEIPTKPRRELPRPPSFGQWLKQIWLDAVTLLLWGGVGLVVYKLPPAVSRIFAVTFSDNQVVYPELAYPVRGEIIPIWLATILASAIPIAIILVAQLRIKSFWDANNAVIGLLYSLVTAAAFQALLKWLVGGLRPHFLAVCQPDIRLAQGAQPDSLHDLGNESTGSGYGQLYYTSEICTGDRTEVNDSLESFPSGHATAAFAGFVYLSIYLNARLKVFSDHHPSHWKLVLTYAPTIGAVVMSGTLIIDEFHHWYDVAAGAVLGTIMAFSAYRMVFASIWDWRTNHIPLLRRRSHVPGTSSRSLRPAWSRNAIRAGRVPARSRQPYRDTTSSELDGEAV